MKTTVSQYDFERAFKEVRPDNFSYEGLKALFDYLEDYETDLAEEIELDVIALCCEFSEYPTAKKAAEQYGWEPDEDEDQNEDEIEAAALDYLQDQTSVRVFNGGVIIADY